MPASGWRLRRAGAGDHQALALVAGATFLEAFAGVLDGADIVAHVVANNDAAAFARYLGTGAIATLAEVTPGNAPVGYTLLTVPDLPVPVEPGDIELKRIYVLAPWYGEGLAAALMERALSDAREAACRRLLLGVYAGNARARRFYVKHGFEAIGERRFRVGSTWHDDLVFARRLD